MNTYSDLDAPSKSALALAVRAGFQTCPNNIWNLPGIEIGSQGFGGLEPAEWNQTIWIIPGGELVILAETFTRADDGRGQYAHPELARFADVDALVAYLEAHGRRTGRHLPGQAEKSEAAA